MTLQNALGRTFDLAVDLWLLSVCLGGCSLCTTFYRHTSDPMDPKPFYRLDQCPNKPATVVCTSATRLPNSECR